MPVMLSARVKLAEATGMITREWFRLLEELVTVANGGGIKSANIGDQVDLSSRNWSVTLNADGTLLNPKNAIAGQAGFIRINQNDTVAKTLAFGTFWQFAGGVDPTVSTGLSAIDVLVYHVIAADKAACSYIKGVA